MSVFKLSYSWKLKHRVKARSLFWHTQLRWYFTKNMTEKYWPWKIMDKIITKSLSLSLFTMPAFVLTIRHGGNLSAITILLLSLIVLLSQPLGNLILNKKEKVLIFSLLLLPIIIALDVILRDLKFKYLDYYLRFILVIPIYFALKMSSFILL